MSVTSTSIWHPHLKPHARATAVRARCPAPPIEIRRSARRSFGIEVHPDLRVIVRAPLRCPESIILQFLASRQAWIARQQAHSRSQPPRPSPTPAAQRRSPVGQAFALRLLPGAAAGVQFADGVLEVRGRHACSEAAVARAVLAWYQQEARRIFEQLVDQWHGHPRFQRYPRPPLRIRAMRSRCGSLSPRTGMCLNLLLIHAPLAAIEYVVVHELCHLRYRGHGKGFYSVLDAVLPDWRARRKLLEASLRAEA
jgi:predicted metal-dependent hydrolase